MAAPPGDDGAHGRGHPGQGDAEALCYLYPASLEAPLDSEWTEIYLYVATRICDAMGRATPSGIRVEKLSPSREDRLRDLKAWIYWKRVQYRPRDHRPQAEVEAAAMAMAEKTPIRPVQFELFSGFAANQQE